MISGAISVLTLVLGLWSNLLSAQNDEKAEKRALTCFERQLVADGLSKEQIFEFQPNFRDAFHKRDSDKMRQLVNEVDSLMQNGEKVRVGVTVAWKF